VEALFDATAHAALVAAQAVADPFGQIEPTTAHLFRAILDGKTAVIAACLRSAGIDLTATAEAVAAFVRMGH
jgi:hypothetical protein